MLNSETYHHFALYGAIVSWIFGIWLSIRTKNEDKKTTSELATTSKSNYLIFATGLTIAGALLALNAYFYMYRELFLPDVLYPLLSIAIGLQIITAWVPDVKGRKHTVHYFAAWVMSYLLLSVGSLLLVSDTGKISTSFQIFGIFILIAMATVGTYAGRPSATNKQFLRSQQLYFFLFQILLLARIYS